MKRSTLIEAMKNVTVLKFERDRNPPGGRATLQVPGTKRQTEVWWHEPPEGQPHRLHFKPYPEGWAELSLSEQSEACKEVIHAILLHEAAIMKHKAQTQQAPRGERKSRR